MRYNSTYTVEDLIGTLSEMDPPGTSNGRSSAYMAF